MISCLRGSDAEFGAQRRADARSVVRLKGTGIFPPTCSPTAPSNGQIRRWWWHGIRVERPVISQHREKIKNSGYRRITWHHSPGRPSNNMLRLILRQRGAAPGSYSIHGTINKKKSQSAEESKIQSNVHLYTPTDTLKESALSIFFHSLMDYNDLHYLQLPHHF